MLEKHIFEQLQVTASHKDGVGQKMLMWGDTGDRYFYGLCHSGVSVSSRHLWIYSENVPVRYLSVFMEEWDLLCWIGRVVSLMQYTTPGYDQWWIT
ncbi:hypothetical protein HGM15179_003343 [Zosterops borbonicus]|uniref:Uncharacterized protein n=1 Tax=Zosterops borbonicus TaxID=364589 RepID=A0A8K1LRZ7_9PASS|nr:hypothetical protein HGM15179_003343 [Zosterops borbonicus]